MTANDYGIEVHESPMGVDAHAWNELLASQPEANPFQRHEYLAAMHRSGSATPDTGWTPRFITLWSHTGAPATAGTSDRVLVGACALYLKDHSYGE